jgi:hypothetical protein
MLFSEIITVYSENYTKHIITICEKNAEVVHVQADGTYSYHYALEDCVLEVAVHFSFLWIHKYILVSLNLSHISKRHD